MPTPKSRKVIVKGQEIELFYIDSLAFELGRSTQTIRKWEIGGVIPKALFKDKNNRRMYSREQIDIILQCAEETEIKQGYSIANTSFASKCHKRIGKLNKEKYI